MPFFQGASGVDIHGGKFTDIGGNVTKYKGGTHNVNSHNTATTTTKDSNNDSSFTDNRKSKDRHVYTNPNPNIFSVKHKGGRVGSKGQTEVSTLRRPLSEHEHVNQQATHAHTPHLEERGVHNPFVQRNFRTQAKVEAPWEREVPRKPNNHSPQPEPSQPPSTQQNLKFNPFLRMKSNPEAQQMADLQHDPVSSDQWQGQPFDDMEV